MIHGPTEQRHKQSFLHLKKFPQKDLLLCVWLKQSKLRSGEGQSTSAAFFLSVSGIFLKSVTLLSHATDLNKCMSNERLILVSVETVCLPAVHLTPQKLLTGQLHLGTESRTKVEVGVG